MLGEGEGRLHQRPDLIGEETGVLVESGELLPIAFDQFRFVVPGVDVARAAIHEQPDHGFRLGREMSGFGREGVEPLARAQAERIEEAGQADEAQSAAGFAPEFTTGGEHR